MAKLKILVLILLVIVLADFAFENPQQLPVLRLFHFDLGQLPIFLLAYLSLAVGLIAGWLAHALRARRKRRKAAVAEAALLQQQQESPQSNQDHQAPQ